VCLADNSQRKPPLGHSTSGSCYASLTTRGAPMVGRRTPYLRLAPSQSTHTTRRCEMVKGPEVLSIRPLASPWCSAQTELGPQYDLLWTWHW